ncbi:hypothetical protein BDF20DRAFT_905156 [Mycotypha africana]|uniref:uncharacterized protein n=1 Tax=Mycotypha africana TaxID=64632 RepID=UPI0023010CE0|nr:uncharacterized protein BDF20DRAFT_905156 [Mycotypha africana]KAI8984026.1 hypothetical protein BDF20DRAFT_905156 [Mycotypha africana]
MEAKVHDATNNEPWGASTSLMQEIAQGTYNYQYFNEIMPTIYRRFTEKAPNQWRQIYKALVLLEYLIKNGSERVVDDARSHVSMIKIMRNFYYIDDKGKDEGLNVRNRAKEIVELLGNTEKIRAERKLARKNRNKYVGVSSDAAGGIGSTGIRGGFSSSSGSSSRFVGFGSDSLFGRSGGSSTGHGISFNGDAMSFGEETPYPHQTGKYDLDDDEEDFDSNSNKNSREDEDDFAEYTSATSASKDKGNQHTDDEDDWGDFTCGEQPSVTNMKANESNILDDDFADFQSARNDLVFTSAATPTTSSTNKAAQQNLFDLLDDTASPTTAASLSPSTTAANNINLSTFEAKQPITPSSANNGFSSSQQQTTQPSNKPTPTTVSEEKKKDTPLGMWAQASNFVSLDSLGKKPQNNSAVAGPSINSLKHTSVQASWNNWANNNSQSPTPSTKPVTANAATSSSPTPFGDLLG